MPLKDLLTKSDTEDYDASVVRDMPTYPGMALTYHVVLKNVQVGATLGSLVGCAAWLKGSERKLPDLVFKNWPRGAGIGAAAGIFSGSAMMLYKMRKIDADGLEDRSYRIIRNKGIQSVDFYSELGGMTCLLLGLSRGRFGGGVAAGAKKMLSGLSEGGARAGTKKVWSLTAQGISAGFVGYMLGTAVGLPLQKPLDLLGVKAFKD